MIFSYRYPVTIYWCQEMETKLRYGLLMVILSISCHQTYAGMSSSISSGDYATDLGSIYGVIKTYGYTKDICIEQFPDMRKQIDDAYNKWRKKYRPFTQEIKYRLDTMMLNDSNQNHTSVTTAQEYMNDIYEELRRKVKSMYAKDGLKNFRNLCERYPKRLDGEQGDLEKYYPEHMETIRKVKIS